jgi:hypothetical protein
MVRPRSHAFGIRVVSVVYSVQLSTTACCALPAPILTLSDESGIESPDSCPTPLFSTFHPRVVCCSPPFRTGAEIKCYLCLLPRPSAFFADVRIASPSWRGRGRRARGWGDEALHAGAAGGDRHAPRRRKVCGSTRRLTRRCREQRAIRRGVSAIHHKRPVPLLLLHTVQQKRMEPLPPLRLQIIHFQARTTRTPVRAWQPSIPSLSLDPTLIPNRTPSSSSSIELNSSMLRYATQYSSSPIRHRLRQCFVLMLACTPPNICFSQSTI